jgi:hypothetical protein
VRARRRRRAVGLVAQARRTGQNANAVTGQGLTDMGRAATFYDCLVEVSRSGARV